MLPKVEDFVGSKYLSLFSISSKETCWKENLSLASIFCLINFMLGWHLYISMASSTGSHDLFVFVKFFYVSANFNPVVILTK